jgi:hypothetical protein
MNWNDARNKYINTEASIEGFKDGIIVSLRKIDSFPV